MFTVSILLGLVVFALLAATLGVDSRDASDDPHRSVYPTGID